MTSNRMAHLLRLLGLASPPVAPSEGEVWYDTVGDRVMGSDGVAGIPLTVGPGGNLPVIRAGAWHALPAYGAQGSANVPAGRMFALPFWPGRRSTLTAVAGNVTLALVGGNLRFGLYASNGVLPTTLIADFGTVTAGVTGVRQITGLSTVVRPVLHYLVVGRQGGAVNLGLTTRASWDPIVSETVPTIANNYNAYYIDGVTGALPATFGTPAGAETGPGVSLQLT